MNVPGLASAFMLAWLVPYAPSASAQGGYDTETHPEHGLIFPRARHYEAIPTQPNERSVVLRFAEKKERAVKKERRVIPQMWIVRMDHGAEGDAEPPQSFDEYLELRFEGWSRGEPVAEDEEKGWRGTEYELAHESLESLAGWAHVWERPGVRSFVVVGTGHAEDFEEQSKIWRHTAARMKFGEPTVEKEARAREKWRRYYERRNFVDGAHRVDVRLSLTDGWKADDTKNYIVVYDTTDKPLVRRVMRDLEILRQEYERLFTPVEPVTAASTVRICKDRIEYLQYGGSPDSVGYWSAQTEELVLYDATKQLKNERKDRQDTYTVLYHEAFHQFIHYSAGELEPHPWYNEGNGDYFSGAVIVKGKLIKIGSNPWRSEAIKAAAGSLQHVPWKDIVRYEREDYYANPRVCYAQGWSMVYFLNTSREVKKHPVWSKILTTYFDELKKAWALEFERIEEKGGSGDEEWVAAAQVRARRLAADVAFDGVDLDEIERAWIAFVEEL